MRSAITGRDWHALASHSKAPCFPSNMPGSSKNLKRSMKHSSPMPFCISVSRTAQIYQHRNAGAEPLEPASLRRRRRPRTRARLFPVPACGALHLSHMPNRSRNAPRRPQSPLVGQCGDYVCNETLYLSLGRSAARMAGFIHVPRLARASRQKAASRSRRPDLASLTRAALIAILVTARKIRQDRAQARDATPAHQDFVKTPGKRPALDRVRSMA